jgi:N utilization substance protein B
MKSSRRRAREFALQGLYQWQLAKHTAGDILAQLSEANGFAKVDADYLRTLLEGVIGDPERLEAALTPMLDRKFAELSPIERGLLMMGAYELACQPEKPYRVVITKRSNSPRPSAAPTATNTSTACSTSWPVNCARPKCRRGATCGPRVSAALGRMRADGFPAVPVLAPAARANPVQILRIHHP